MSDLKPVVLTSAQCMLANVAFTGLDGYNRIVADKSVFVPFKFSDEVRTAMRRWKRAVKEVADDYAEANQELVRELSPEKGDVSLENATTRAAFFERLNKIGATEHKFLLPRLKLNGDLLHEGKNPIPGSVLDGLDPIIEDQPATAATEGDA